MSLFLHPFLMFAPFLNTGYCFVGKNNLSVVLFYFFCCKTIFSLKVGLIVGKNDILQRTNYSPKKVQILSWKTFFMASSFQKFSKQIYFWNLKKTTRHMVKKFDSFWKTHFFSYSLIVNRSVFRTQLSMYPAGIYLLKFNNRSTTALHVWNMFKVNNKDTRPTPWRRPIKKLFWNNWNVCALRMSMAEDLKKKLNK